MELPQNTNLPFFSYGIFKPGELGFLRIKDYVLNQKKIILKGNLLLRDGLPIIDLDGDWEVKGHLLYFNENSYETPYQRIIEIEPEKHYRWGTVPIKGNKQNEANILIGRSPNRGSVQSEDKYFKGRRDPLFNEAFELIEQIIDDKKYFTQDYKDFFKLQMAYLLLWTIIEKYVSLRYHLGDRVNDKIHQLKTDQYFCSQLKINIKYKRNVFRADRPSDKETLDPEKPNKCIDYYYQIRSNITHRGKATHNDFEMLHLSATELCGIMKATIGNAFEESIVQN
jgi:hypothetical protein